jgi:capsular polysaccharide transport system permease protein
MERRALEITEIQKDIAKRRRRKLALLLTRLSFFVALPTFLAAWYFYVIATPMYSTKSEFVILQADNAGGAGLGGLLSGTQFATSQDSIAMQSFLESKEAMLRLDEDLSFKDHFSQDDIDAIQRLGDNPTNEEAYKTYKKNIKIGYDPTEGVIRMEVITADPQVGAEFSTKLIEYAQDRVNGLSQQKRGDQMADAQASFEDAMTKRREAQQQLVELQQKGAILDPEGVIASLRSQINNVELQLQEKTLQLQALLDNSRPNQSRVDGARGDVRRLEALLAELNDKMTSASEGENSLAQLSGRIQMAQSDLASRDLMLQSALQQMEQTRLEANRQVRYLTTSVEPVAAQEASYPRAFENTLLAFLIFGGIYLMISLTSSILREQVTS